MGSPPTPSSSKPILAGLRALIVDDNSTNRHVLEEMISAWGCSTETADGADAGFAKLLSAVEAGHPFDVLLLDLNMPEIDGYGLARRVRAEPATALTPMVMLTSSAQRGEAEKSEKEGIAGYLTKPVRALQLRRVLEEATGPVVSARSGRSALKNEPRNANSRSGEPRLADGPATVQLGPVLVVEDNRVNQKVVVAQLGQLGCAVDVASNGIEALEHLEARRYAAVLMDCQMPMMDGYDATGELRRREGADRHTPVIGLTASAMAADRARCLDAGMDDYLAKPVQVDSLASALRRWASPNPSPATVETDRGSGDPAAVEVDNGAPELDDAILDELRELGDSAFLDEMVSLFRDDIGRHLSQLDQAVGDRNSVAVRQAAHSVSGASANMGACRLAAAAAALETLAQSGNLDGAPAMTVEIGVRYRRACVALGELISR